MSAPLLTLEDVHAFYGEAHILQGVSLNVGEGEVVTLIGRNGAGKTTTLRSIMGIVPARLGRIAFAGRELRGLPIHAVARAVDEKVQGRHGRAISRGARRGGWGRRCPPRCRWERPPP